MKLRAIAAGATAMGVALAFALPAAAEGEDALGIISALVEQAGQEVGQASVNSESIFLYARGVAGQATASTPAPSSPYSYEVELASNGATAADAISQREGAIGRMRDVAKAYDVAIDVSDAHVSLPSPAAVALARQRAAPRPRAGEAPVDVTPPAPLFDATATLRFGKPAADREAAFLDALHGAGADNLSDPNAPRNGGAPAVSIALPGIAETGDTDPKHVDPKLWDVAGAAAITAAHDEAAALAHAAGRELGEARQIVVIARSVVRGQPTVLVGVRYGLVPKP